MCKTETRVLIKAIEPDIDLWRIVGTDVLELRFEMESDCFISHQSDDTGHFAKLLYQNGHYSDFDSALTAINHGGLS